MTKKEEVLSALKELLDLLPHPEDIEVDTFIDYIKEDLFESMMHNDKFYVDEVIYPFSDKKIYVEVEPMSNATADDLISLKEYLKGWAIVNYNQLLNDIKHENKKRNFK